VLHIWLTYNFTLMSAEVAFHKDCGVMWSDTYSAVDTRGLIFSSYVCFHMCCIYTVFMNLGFPFFKI
jgi:hypothetical protein